MLKSMGDIVKFGLKSPECVDFESNIEISLWIEQKNNQKEKDGNH